MKTNFTVTQFGKELDKNKYTWNENTKTFMSNENDLMLDFNGMSDCTFNTGSYCTLNTCSDCTFNTGSNCTFDTDFYCTFNTDSNCIFKTGSNCTFDTGSNCTFNTSSDCTFNTDSNCIFKTGYDCTFNTNSNCVIIRRDIYEVIELEKHKKIKLNGYNIKGFTYIEEPKLIKIKTIDGQELEITEEKAKELGFNIK